MRQRQESKVMKDENKNQNTIGDAERIVKMAQSGRRTRKSTRSKAFRKQWEEMMAWKREQLKEREINEHMWGVFLHTAEAITKIKGEENVFMYTEMKPHLEFLETLQGACWRLGDEWFDKTVDAEKRREIEKILYSICVSTEFLNKVIE